MTNFVKNFFMKTKIKIKANLPVFSKTDAKGNTVFSDAKGNEILSYNPKGDLYDLYAAEDVELKGPKSSIRTWTEKESGQQKITVNNSVVFESAIFSLGIAVKLPDGYMSEVHPRSSTFGQKKIMLTNSEGQIDHSYMGNNDIWKFGAVAFEDTKISKGDKIAQFRIHLSQHASIWQKIKWLFSNKIELEFVDELEGENRGGFGSTGGYK